MASLTPYERETIIRTSEADDDFWHVYTCSPPFANKMRKLGLTPTNVERCEGREVAWFFEAPKEWVLHLRPIKKVSTERKEAARQRALEAMKQHGGIPAFNAPHKQEGVDSPPKQDTPK